MWQPEMLPIAYTMISKDRPNASETPSVPILDGSVVASTALPTPPMTRTAVPISSAAKIRTRLFIGLEP